MGAQGITQGRVLYRRPAVSLWTGDLTLGALVLLANKWEQRGAFLTGLLEGSGKWVQVALELQNSPANVRGYCFVMGRKHSHLVTQLCQVWAFTGFR